MKLRCDTDILIEIIFIFLSIKHENLKKDLQKLGIIDAFSAVDADFSNMSDVPLSVDQAIHQAMIDFSEKGIKAAAVTVFMIKANGMFMEPEEIHYVTIDHPFLTFISVYFTFFFSLMYFLFLILKNQVVLFLA